MNKLCEICNGEPHDPITHPYLPQMETHNPLDIPFGYEMREHMGNMFDGTIFSPNTTEINKNVKDVDEGGMGSGRHPDMGDPIDKSSQPGGLLAFETVSVGGGLSGVDIGGKKIEETVSKQIADQRLNCRCNRTQ